MNLQTRNNRQGEKIHLHLDKDIEAKLSIVTVYFLDYKLFRSFFMDQLYSQVVREQHQGLIQTPLSTRIISKLTALPTDAMLLQDGASICDLVASSSQSCVSNGFSSFLTRTRADNICGQDLLRSSKDQKKTVIRWIKRGYSILIFMSK